MKKTVPDNRLFFTHFKTTLNILYYSQLHTHCTHSNSKCFDYFNCETETSVFKCELETFRRHLSVYKKSKQIGTWRLSYPCKKSRQRSNKSTNQSKTSSFRKSSASDLKILSVYFFFFFFFFFFLLIFLKFFFYIYFKQLVFF